MVIALSVLLAFQMIPPAAPRDHAKETCSVSGTVLDSITGQPVSKVALQMFSADAGARVTSTSSSDANGDFSLVGLEPGSYRLSGDRSGYVQTYYSARGWSQSGSIIRLEAGQTLKDLRFRLMPAGTVAGTVRDSDGEPLEGAQVELGKIVYDNHGKFRLAHEGNANSDDRGEYRFHGLGPGRYFVSASEHRTSWANVVDRSGSKRPEEMEVLTFYPTAPDTSTASAVELQAGRHVEGIDIRMLKVHAVCIGGRVVTAGRPKQSSVGIEADLKAASDMYGKFRASTIPDAEGTFQMCGVPSGGYLLSGYSDGLSTRVSLTVGSVDVNDIRLAPQAGATMQGRVGSDGAEKPNLSTFMIMVDQDGKEMSTISQLDQRDDAFTLTRLGAGHYEFRTTPPPTGFYLKSIRSGNTDALADGLTISGAETIPVEFTLSHDGSAVSGVVLDKDQNPVAGATVLAAPADRARYNLFAHVTADQQGHYEFDALAPGSYRLFAFDEVETNAWNDPEFLRPYEKQAAKAELEPKGKVSIDLKIVAPNGQ